MTDWKGYAKNIQQMALIFRGASPDGVLPTWILADRNENTQIFGTAWGNDEEKRAAVKIIAEVIVEYKIHTVIFLVDAWTRNVPLDAPEEEKIKMPSQEIDAVEAIVVECWKSDKTGFCLMQMYRQLDNGLIESIDSMEADNPDTHTEVFQPVLDALYAQK